MFSVVEMLACPNRPLTADTGTWSAISKVALEWRKLWKWAEVRSFAFKNLLNQLVMLCGSNGAPSALVKIRSFLMVLPHISTVRTHADPMRKRCSRCIWRYSRSSSIQLSPTRIIRRERLVLGGAKTTPAPGILCMVVNHIDNQALYLYAVDRLKNKPLMNKIFECSGLLDGLEDKEVSGKLSAAISDAIELAEDYAFDAGAELQSAISADELTSHEDGAEAHADTNTSTSEDTPNTIEYVQDAREFIAALSRKELKEFGHDEINGADQMIVALNAIEQLAKHDNAAAWECYGDFMESNLCGVSFKIES